VRAVLFVVLLALPVAAQMPRPMAVCKDGERVIAQKDWEQFMEFHKRVRSAIEHIDRQTEMLNGEVQGTRNELARCEARLDRNRT
jgi:hypothetical protein